jgi:hypothetical protein
MSVKSNDLRDVPRFRFIVDIELTDLQSGMQIKARTKDLSLFGCSIDTLKPFPEGTSVGIGLFHGGRYMLANAKVVYASPKSGMGFAFLGIEAEYERILDGWIVQLSTVNRPN